MGVVLASIILAIFTYSVINGYSAGYIMRQVFPNSAEGVYKPYALTEGNFGSGALIEGGGGIIYVMDEGLFSTYDDNGDEISSEIRNLEESGLSAEGDYALLYDRKNGNFEIYKKGKLVESGSVQRPVLGAVMHREGYAAFILEGRDGFLGRMTLVDKTGESVAICDYSDRYPVSACLSHESDRFAVAGMIANEPEKTAVDIYAIGKDSPVAGVKYETSLPLVMSGDDDVFITVGTSQAVIYGFSENEIGRINLNNAAEVKKGRNGFFVLTQAISGDKIVFMDKNAEISWTYDTKIKVKGMTESISNIIYWDGTNMGGLDGEGDEIEIPGGFGTVLGTVDLGMGKIAVLTPKSLVLYEYR